MAAQLQSELKIPITTFMIAKDPYLQQFVRKFTSETNGGKAFYSSLNGLGEYIFEDYITQPQENGTLDVGKLLMSERCAF